LIARLAATKDAAELLFQLLDGFIQIGWATTIDGWPVGRTITIPCQAFAWLVSARSCVAKSQVSHVSVTLMQRLSVMAMQR